MPVSLEIAKQNYAAALTDDQKQVLDDKQHCRTTIDDANNRALHLGILQSLADMPSAKGARTITGTDKVILNQKGTVDRFRIPTETLYKAGNSLLKNSPMRVKINREIQQRFLPDVNEAELDACAGDMLSSGRQCTFEELLAHADKHPEMPHCRIPLLLGTTISSSDSETMKELASTFLADIGKNKVGVLSIFDGDHHLSAFCTKEADSQDPKWVVMDSYPFHDNAKQNLREQNIRKLLGNNTTYIANDMQKNAPNACIPLAVMLRNQLSALEPMNDVTLQNGMRDFVKEWAQLTPGLQKSEVNKLRLKLLEAVAERSGEATDNEIEP